jgi:hypothetical protein
MTSAGYTTHAAVSKPQLTPIERRPAPPVTPRLWSPADERRAQRQARLADVRPVLRYAPNHALARVLDLNRRAGEHAPRPEIGGDWSRCVSC